MRSLRSQLKAASAKNPPSPLAESIKSLDAKAAAIEGSEGGYGSRFLSTPEGRSLARLNGGLGTMLAQLDTADAAPTTQEVSMFGEVEKALDEQLAAWSQLKSKDVPQLNEELKKAGQPADRSAKTNPSRSRRSQLARPGSERGIGFESPAQIRVLSAEKKFPELLRFVLT